MTRKPPANPVPRDRKSPGERVWSVQKAGRQIDCELSVEPRGGWQCQFFDEDWRISAYHADSRADALAHAEQQRQGLLREGWRMID